MRAHDDSNISPMRKSARQIVETRRKAIRAAHDKNKGRWERPSPVDPIRKKTPRTPGDYARLTAAGAKRARKAHLRRQLMLRSAYANYSHVPE